MDGTSDKDYIDAKADGVRAELHTYRDVVDARFDGIHAAIAAAVATLRAEMERNTAMIIKWVAGVWIASLVLFFTGVTFVLNNAIPKFAAAAPPQAPIIIQMPPWPIAPSAAISAAAPAASSALTAPAPLVVPPAPASARPPPR